MNNGVQLALQVERLLSVEQIAGKEVEQCNGIAGVDIVGRVGSFLVVYFGVIDKNGQHAESAQHVNPLDSVVCQLTMAILHTVPFFPSAVAVTTI